jgi:hypothetical protein
VSRADVVDHGQTIPLSTLGAILSEAKEAVGGEIPPDVTQTNQTAKEAAWAGFAGSLAA